MHRRKKELQNGACRAVAMGDGYTDGRPPALFLFVGPGLKQVAGRVGFKLLREHRENSGLRN